MNEIDAIEQALRDVQFKLSAAVTLMEAKQGREHPASLETDRFFRRFVRLRRSLTKSVVEQVADLNEPGDGEFAYAWDTPGMVQLRHYDNDFHQWSRVATPADRVSLALWLLGQDYAFTSVQQAVLDLLHKADVDQGRRFKQPGCVYECPRCQDTVPTLECRRCRGLGYLVQNTPPDDREYEITREGREALNQERPWTLEDERRVLIEESGYDPEDPRVQRAWVPGAEP